VRDPRLYDAVVASRNRGWDVDLYLELAKTAAPPVLEIGSSTGRSWSRYYAPEWMHTALRTTRR
jgi:hypothetical protein